MKFRDMYAIRPIVLLTLTYLALTANLEPINVIAGLIIAALVVLLVRPQPHKVDWRQVPEMTVALGRYVLVLIYDLVVSGVQVARIVLDPKLPIKPGIIAIPSRCRSEMASALNAHAITLTPGESVIEMGEDGVMYTHCLDADQSKELIEQAQDLRVNLLEKIFN
ncbi:MAG: Na+/H+ antiporter subunit E [Chloroflexota bacterium]